VGGVGRDIAGVAVSLAIAEETNRTAKTKAGLEIPFRVRARLNPSDIAIP
jgi:hypothetical protein